MKRITLLFVLVISGCVAPLETIGPDTCVVRGVYIEGDVGILGATSYEYEGTQVSIINFKACPGVNIKMPAPRDSSKTIDVTSPGD